MNKREIATAKRTAQFHLERARKTSKLRRIPDASEEDVDLILLPDGSRYENILDDIEALQDQLKAASLTLADIGTDERELIRLEAASTRLNAPYAEKRRHREANRMAIVWGEDDA